MRRHFLSIFIFVISTVCADDPEILYLSWQNDPASTMTIHWLTKEGDAEKKVVYAEKKDSETRKEVSALCQKLPKDVGMNLCTCELKGLKADTLYSFRLVPSNTEYFFRTMPQTLNDPVRFIVGGDVFDHSLDVFEETIKQAVSKNPNFIAFGGDIAYSVHGKKKNFDDFDRWLKFLSACTKLFKASDNTIIPMVVTIGNHEVEGFYDQTPDKAPFFYAFFRPDGQKAYKALRFGNYLHFIILDSGHTNTVYGAQTEWLNDEMKLSKNFLHKFAIYHVPAYPSYRYYRNSLSASIRRNWCPLFEKYELDAAFEHHDHAFKRTHPLKAEHFDRFGVVYFGDGCWGAHPRTPKKASWTTYLAKTASTRQFLQVDISKAKRHFQAIDPDGNTIDSYEQMVGGPS